MRVLTRIEISDGEADVLLDEWHENDERVAKAVPLYEIVTPQSFLYQDRVDFYATALSLGMCPPPTDGLRLEDGRVFLIDGNHRCEAWAQAGFRDALVRVQERGEI